MDARYGFLWGADPKTWDGRLLRALVVGRGRVQLNKLPRRYQAAAADLAGAHGLVLRRAERTWEVTL